MTEDRASTHSLAEIDSHVRGRAAFDSGEFRDAPSDEEHPIVWAQGWDAAERVDRAAERVDTTTKNSLLESQELARLRGQSAHEHRGLPIPPDDEPHPEVGFAESGGSIPREGFPKVSTPDEIGRDVDDDFKQGQLERDACFDELRAVANRHPQHAVKAALEALALLYGQPLGQQRSTSGAYISRRGPIL